MEKQPRMPSLLQTVFAHHFTNVVEKLLSSIPPLNRNQLSTEECLNFNLSQSLFSLKPLSAAFVHRQLRLLKVARYSFSGTIPPKFERKLRRHKQRFQKINTTVVLDNDVMML